MGLFKLKPTPKTCIRSRVCWDCKHLIDFCGDVHVFPVSCGFSAPKQPAHNSDQHFKDESCPHFTEGMSLFKVHAVAHPRYQKGQIGYRLSKEERENYRRIHA